MYVRTYVCITYVCMYVYTHTHTHVSSNSLHPVFRQAAHNYKIRLKYTEGPHVLNRHVFKS